MSLLLLTPSPHPTESLLGYVLRLSEENAYDSPWHVLAHAGVRQDEMFSPGFPVEKLVSVTGRSLGAFERISYRSQNKSNGYQLLGHSLGDSSACRPLRLRKPGFCLFCAEEFGFIDAFWDLAFATACRRHRTKVTTVCSSCGEALSWFRPGLLQCKCGADLRQKDSSDASEAVLDLMDVLWAKLHGISISISLSPQDAVPYAALANLSMRDLISFVRKLGSFALLANSGSAKGNDESTVQAAAEILSQWPMNFHQMLRNLDVRLGVRPDSTSIVARLRIFYSSMLKRKPQHAFLHDEFIQFGAKEWGEGLVDARMLSEGADRRFTSRADLSRRSGIDPRTLSKWASKGQLSLKIMGSELGRRYLVDASQLPAKSNSAGSLMEERSAARSLGIPFPVLAALKGSHYAAENSPAMKSGYHSTDVEAFRAKLQDRAAAAGLLSSSVPISETITLSAVMKQVRFGGPVNKAAFLGSYLDGKVEGFRANNSAESDIVFLRSTVDAYARSSRASNQFISKTAAGKMIGCSVAVVSALVAENLISSCTEQHGRVRKDSVESFAERYVPLWIVATQSLTKVSVLLSLSERIGLTVLKIRAGQKTWPAVLREQAAQLRDLKTPKRVIRRPPPVEALKQYLDDLARSGAKLPRKGMIPNKSKIARVCGFDRGLFFDNAEIISLLEQASLKDAVHNL